MRAGQKAVKYAALGLGLALAAVIIGGIIAAMSGIIGKTGQEKLESMNFLEDFSAADIESLDISNEEGNLSIVTGDKFQVEANNVPETFVAKVEGGTLKVAYTESNRWSATSFFGIGGNNFDDAVIIITVPEEFCAKQCELDNGSGKMEVQSLAAKEMEIDLGSGNFTLEDGNFEHTEINCGSGKVNISDTVLGEFLLDGRSGLISVVMVECDSVELKTGSGSLDFVGTAAGDVALDAGSGSVSLTLVNARSDFKIAADAGSGGFWLQGEKVDSFEDSSDAAYELTMEGGSGRVSVAFKEK